MANYETQIFAGRFPGEKTRVPKKVALQLPLHCSGVRTRDDDWTYRLTRSKRQNEICRPRGAAFSYDRKSIGKNLPVSSQWLLESWKNHEQTPDVFLFLWKLMKHT